MRTVYKYPLEITDEQEITAAKGWRPLAVQKQGNDCYLWAEVDDQARLVPHKVYVHGTGHQLDPNAIHYVGTLQLAGGALIFHVFTEDENAG